MLLTQECVIENCVATRQIINFVISYSPIIQSLVIDEPYQLDVLRLDLMNPFVNGNKWFKLKYNLMEAKKNGHRTIITFGGANSNHIAAFAAASKIFGFKSIGIIRREKQQDLTPTLLKAKEDGMILHFVSRDEYLYKNTDEFKTKLFEIYGDHFFIPEGGNNLLGVKGCSEILKEEWNYKYIFCACGTAATFTGLLLKAKQNSIIVGISVLKGENELVQDSNAHLLNLNSPHLCKGDEELEKETITESFITNQYSFNGYAKFDKNWYGFKKDFEIKHQLSLDYIYTSKLAFAISDLMKRKKLRIDSKILMIHTGGMQGNSAFESRYQLIPNL